MILGDISGKGCTTFPSSYQTEWSDILREEESRLYAVGLAYSSVQIVRLVVGLEGYEWSQPLCLPPQ